MTEPADLISEAKVFAEAAISMLDRGEIVQAALLLVRAAEFAEKAA